MNSASWRYVPSALATLILAACATQNPAPVVDGSGTGVGIGGVGTNVYTPNNTNPAVNNPYGATPYQGAGATTNQGTEAYPVHTDSSVYTPSNTGGTVYTPPANTGYTAPSSTYVGNYSPVDVNATYHTVVRGDTVYNIAKRYGISQDNLRAWNGLNGNEIGVGQRLRVKPQGYKGGASSNAAAYQPVASGAGTHRVVAGDTVYNISKRYGISQEQLRSLNGLSGNDIKIGQVLRLGSNAAVGNQYAQVNNPYVPPKPTVPVPATTPAAPVAVATPAARTYQFSGITWQTPLVNGVVSEKFTTANRSVKLAGSSGQTVAAAADGQVIFSGPGPRGYGNLVVVQHTPQYLSAYGHNQTLLVRELQQVKRGESLGTLSSTGNLLFEVRQDGKPIDPLTFMQL